MDFAAQLANLERSANAARRRPANNDRSNGNDRPRQRQRREYEGRHPQQQNKVPFQSLQRAGYRIDPPPFAKEELPEKRPVRHICLLAVSIDDLPYEDIWKQWANPNPSNSHHQQNIEHGENPPIVSLVCHAKYPMNVKSEFLKQHLLQEPPTIGRGNQLADPVFRSHCPEWGSVEILRAMLDILHDGLLIGNATNVDPRFDPKRYLLTPWDQQEALENETNKASPDQNPPSIPPADVFVFISETCLPIQPLHAWCDALDANRSWLNARNRETPGTPRNKYELDQFSQIRMVPGNCRWKADQWMALCRSHAIAVREIDNHMPERERLWSKGFSHVSASDEMYFPTVLAVLQLLKENEELPEAQNEATNKVLVQKRAVTYTDWSQGMKNPASHTMADLARVVDAARNQKSLVARKFVGAIDIAEWERLCNTPTRAEGYSHEDDDAQLVDEGA